MREAALVAGALVGALTATACVSDGSASTISGVTVADGLNLEEDVVGLDGPTQFLVLEDGRVVIAEIGGEENGETGRISVLASRRSSGGAPVDGGSASVVVNGLDKPTGVAVFNDRLWVMERNVLSAGPWSAASNDVALSPTVADMPFNGRSQGTLTPTPDGRALLYNTSGRLRDGEVTEGSGELRSISTADESTVVATGLKHGYAHVYDDEGQLWVTELSDGTFDGEPAADEIVAVNEGDDLGWPHCVGNNRAVEEFGGNEATCASVPASLAVFGPQATPTSVVVAPWNPDSLLVALWVTGEIVEVDRTAQGAEPVTLVSGLSGPQHLVVDDDVVLISEYQAGRILELSRP